MMNQSYHKGYHTHKKTQTKLNGENKKHVNLKLCCRGLQPTFTSECPSDQCLKFIDDVTVFLCTACEHEVQQIPRSTPCDQKRRRNFSLDELFSKVTGQTKSI